MNQWPVVEAYRRDQLRRADAAHKAGAHAYARAWETSAKSVVKQWDAGKLIVPAIADSLGLVVAPQGLQTLPLPDLAFDAADGDIRQAADACAMHCEYRLSELLALDLGYQACESVCARMGIDPARLRIMDGKPQYGPAVARMCCPRWWRRRLRTMVVRRVEDAAVKMGRVSVKSQLYCSDKCVRRRRASAKRNAEILARMQAVNELGEVFSLQELAELGVSNPVMRRAELMTRIKGLEQIADQRGDAGLFLTWTLPSRFHAVHWKTGRINRKYEDLSPREGNAELCQQWARVRAALAARTVVSKDGKLVKAPIKLYGLRVAEPQHDGTPHWHLLLWFPRKQMRMVCATIAEYAFGEGDEEGARHARLKFETIKKSKGGAVAYIAKYLAKNVDGFQLEFGMTRNDAGDLELSSKDARTAAERVRAWASCWGIRQFQFFGDAPVSVWREVRRLRDEVQDVAPVEAVRIPANEPKGAGYADYVNAAGGVLARAKDRPVAIYRESLPDAPANRYGDESAKPVRGLIARNGAGVVVTRRHSWTVIQGQGVADQPPWTRVNNCKSVAMLDEATDEKLRDGQQLAQLEKINQRSGNSAGLYRSGNDEKEGQR